MIKINEKYYILANKRCYMLAQKRYNNVKEKTEYKVISYHIHLSDAIEYFIKLKGREYVQYEDLTLDEIAKVIKKFNDSKLKDFLRNYSVSGSELRFTENGKDIAADIIELDDEEDKKDEDTEIFDCND